MAIFELYNFLRDEMPLLATFIALVLAGLILSHLLHTEEIGSLFSPIVATIALILSILAIIPCIFMAGNQLFDVVFDILRTGFGPFFLHILVAVVGFFVGYTPAIIYSSLYTAKLKKNPVTKKAIALAKELQATAMVCCYDGVYLSRLPICASSSTHTCKFRDEYDNMEEQLTSIRSFCQSNSNPGLIIFADEGFEDMTVTGMIAFSEAFCDLAKGFRSQHILKTVTYTEPAGYVTYVDADGYIRGGHTEEQNLSKTVDFYIVSQIPNTSAHTTPTAPSQPPKQQW